MPDPQRYDTGHDGKDKTNEGGHVNAWGVISISTLHHNVGPGRPEASPERGSRSVSVGDASGAT